MTEPQLTPDDPIDTTPPGYTTGYPPPDGYEAAPPVPAVSPPATYGPGPVGVIRPTGSAVLIYFVTLGLYALYWFFSVHQEMKEYKRSGLGGGLALLIAIFVGIVAPFVASSEVGELYERDGRRKPVSALTGLWFFPGIFILVGPFIWFIKTNGALNDYWRSVGATGS
jgi:hypothetical protein